MGFHWSLRDCKSPQVSRTCLSILAVLSNAVVWIDSTRTPTSKSSRPFNNPLITVPNAPIVTFMFHSFFNSLVRSRYLSFFSLSFRFIQWSARIIIIISLRFFSSVLAVSFSLEFEWSQISSSLQDSSQYFGHSHYCCSLDGPHSCSNLQVL